MMVYVIEKSEWHGSAENEKEQFKIIGASLSVDSCKEMVAIDSEYYTFKFSWINDRCYSGYDSITDYGVRYDIRLIPYKMC